MQPGRASMQSKPTIISLKTISILYAISPEKWVHVPQLVWYLTRNLIGSNRVLKRLFTEAKIIAQVHKR
jgi:hypothetical protein